DGKSARADEARLSFYLCLDQGRLRCARRLVPRSARELQHHFSSANGAGMVQVDRREIRPVLCGAKWISLLHFPPLNNLRAPVGGQCERLCYALRRISKA